MPNYQKEELSGSIVSLALELSDLLEQRTERQKTAAAAGGHAVPAAPPAAAATHTPSKKKATVRRSHQDEDVDEEARLAEKMKQLQAASDSSSDDEGAAAGSLTTPSQRRREAQAVQPTAEEAAKRADKKERLTKRRDPLNLGAECSAKVTEIRNIFLALAKKSSSDAREVMELVTAGLDEKLAGPVFENLHDKRTRMPFLEFAVVVVEERQRLTAIERIVQRICDLSPFISHGNTQSVTMYKAVRPMHARLLASYQARMKGKQGLGIGLVRLGRELMNSYLRDREPVLSEHVRVLNELRGVFVPESLNVQREIRDKIKKEPVKGEDSADPANTDDGDQDVAAYAQGHVNWLAGDGFGNAMNSASTVVDVSSSSGTTVTNSRVAESILNCLKIEQSSWNLLVDMAGTTALNSLTKKRKSALHAVIQKIARDPEHGVTAAIEDGNIPQLHVMYKITRTDRSSGGKADDEFIRGVGLAAEKALYVVTEMLRTPSMDEAEEDFLVNVMEGDMDLFSTERKDPRGSYDESKGLDSSTIAAFCEQCMAVLRRFDALAYHHFAHEKTALLAAANKGFATAMKATKASYAPTNQPFNRRVAQSLLEYLDLVVPNGRGNSIAAGASGSAAGASSDGLLRGASTSVPAERWGSLAMIARLVGIIPEADLFLHGYRNQLSRRLLMATTIDLDTETDFVNMLTTHVEAARSRRLRDVEGMMRDFTAAKASPLNADVRQALRKGMPQIAAEATILTATFWPAIKQRVTLRNVPVVVQRMLDIVSAAFVERHASKKLSWFHNLSTATLLVKFPLGAKEITVSGTQASILIAVDEGHVGIARMRALAKEKEEAAEKAKKDAKESKQKEQAAKAKEAAPAATATAEEAAASSEEPATEDPKTAEPEPASTPAAPTKTGAFTIGDLCEALGAEGRDLVPHVVGMASKTCRLLQIGDVPAGGTNKARPVQINPEFKAKLRKIRLTNVGTGTKAADGAYGVPSELELTGLRKAQLDGAIVRIMKSRRTLSFTELTSQTISMVASLFVAGQRDVKLRVEELIARNYIRRSPSDAAAVEYVA